jgi:hypothetical protein
MAIQALLDNMEWVSQAGSPVAYAAHLRRTAPLRGVPAKSVIVQFAKGDLGAPNPNTTAILRAGDLARPDLTSTDAVTIVGAALTLIAIALLAGSAPAHRAAIRRIDRVSAFRRT